MHSAPALLLKNFCRKIGFEPPDFQKNFVSPLVMGLKLGLRASVCKFFQQVIGLYQSFAPVGKSA